MKKKEKQKRIKYFRAFEMISEERKLRNSNKNHFHRFFSLIALIIEFQFLPFYFGFVPKWRLLLRRILSKKRISPNYIMTGPIKSGSSDLATHLLLHPNVIPPLAKEIKITETEAWRAYYPTVKEKDRLEKKVKGSVRCGYLFPLLHDVKLIDKLYNLNPQAKIIITLRDPVKRAYSHWKWEIFQGGKTIQESAILKRYSSFVTRALDLHPSIRIQTFCGFPFLETGIYYKALEIWIEKFGIENILVLDVAEYFSDRQEILKRIQIFLNLPVEQIPEYNKKINENPLDLEPADESSISELSKFYKPYNQKLFDLLGTNFDWQ